MSGKAMLADVKPQQRKKEELERLRGEGDKIKYQINKIQESKGARRFINCKF